MRRVGMIFIVAVVAIVTLAGCGPGPGTPGPPEATSSTPTLITMPDVVGENAAVAVDKLTKLGFTNIDLGTVDGRPIVVLPQNWTVKDQSAKPGERLTADAKIVLGCAKIGDRWPVPAAASSFRPPQATSSTSLWATSYQNGPPPPPPTTEPCPQHLVRITPLG